MLERRPALGVRPSLCLVRSARKRTWSRPRLDVTSNPTLSPPGLRGSTKRKLLYASRSPHRPGLISASEEPLRWRSFIAAAPAWMSTRRPSSPASAAFGPDGTVSSEVRTFGTMTAELLALSDWLEAHGVTHVAMESTGVYWKPIFNLLEGYFEVILVNAQRLKQVPGRKTDVKDAEWIAQLLQYGLLSPSFIPPPEIRELRDLTRQRTELIRDRATVANRIQKVLEDANIKLASVASDVLGVSGRAMIQAMIDGRGRPGANWPTWRGGGCGARSPR